ncbi:hypothetical protein TELCIR_09566 [Teladorsagia circumcincta]|uniref:Uncharacterized protein n=1 Tax=Teladorsagia circumcincta TaxID=45464 RepID=A0A2G9UEF2_TELCI|nr:hypothetical protein TELCIR_09566 [Teladorsagia circumcincta]
MPSTKSHHRPAVKVVPTEATKRTTPSTTPSHRPTLKLIPTEAFTATSTVPPTKSHHRPTVKVVPTEAPVTKRTTPSTESQHRPTLKAIPTEASIATSTVPPTKSYPRPTVKAIFTESFATTRPIPSTTVDTFAEFNDRSLFRDISFFDGQAEQSEEKSEEVAQKIHPPTDDLQWAILPNKTTLLKNATSKKNHPNVVRYFVKITRGPRLSPTRRATVSPTAGRTTSTPPTPITLRTSRMRSSTTTEPSITIALPRKVVEEQKLEGFSRRKLKSLLTTTPRADAALKPSKISSNRSSFSKVEGAITSRRSHPVPESNPTETAVPLSPASFASIAQRSSPQLSSLPRTNASAAKSWMSVAGHVERNKTLASTAQNWRTMTAIYLKT